MDVEWNSHYDVELRGLTSQLQKWHYLVKRAVPLALRAGEDASTTQFNLWRRMGKIEEEILGLSCLETPEESSWPPLFSKISRAVVVDGESYEYVPSFNRPEAIPRMMALWIVWIRLSGSWTIHQRKQFLRAAEYLCNVEEAWETDPSEHPMIRNQTWRDLDLLDAFPIQWSMLLLYGDKCHTSTLGRLLKEHFDWRASFRIIKNPAKSKIDAYIKQCEERNPMGYTRAPEVVENPGLANKNSNAAKKAVMKKEIRLVMLLAHPLIDFLARDHPHHACKIALTANQLEQIDPQAEINRKRKRTMLKVELKSEPVESASSIDSDTVSAPSDLDGPQREARDSVVDEQKLDSEVAKREDREAKREPDPENGDVGLDDQRKKTKK